MGADIGQELELDLALAHHQAGRMGEARAAYEAILRSQPEHAQALHLLGILELGMGQSCTAQSLLRRAVQADPKSAQFHADLGVALALGGQLDEAIAAYQRALDLGPPRSDVYNNLANALHQKGMPQQAIEIYRQALALDPSFPEAHNNLGNALKDLDQRESAVAAYQKAIELRPNYSEAWNNLGNILKEMGRPEQVVSAFGRAMSLCPEVPSIQNNLAHALLSLDRVEEALSIYRQALERQSEFPEAWQNLANALEKMGRYDESMAAYRQALRLRTDYATAHYNMGLLLLKLGHFRAGWEECEWRWDSKVFRPFRRSFDKPRWDGSQPASRRILVYAEQGFGDAIQFARYVPLLARCGARVIVEAPPALRKLFDSLDGVEQVITQGEAPPDFDCHVPLLSLAHAMGTETATIPRQVPYLHVDPACLEKWEARLAGVNGKLKIGLAWAGRATPDPKRSMPLAAMSALANVQGAWFTSLQIGDDSAQTQNLPLDFQLTDWTREIHDFSDTAAIMTHLDLVICIDTAVAHLAGALGKPVWVLLHSQADWRWMLGREDSPWYPTMRLFRQASPGDWKTPLKQIRKTLETFGIER